MASPRRWSRRSTWTVARSASSSSRDEYAGKVALILTSPPYGNATLGDPRGGVGTARGRACEGRRITTADRAHASKALRACRYGDSAPCLARLPYGDLHEEVIPGTANAAGESYLSVMASMYTACARMLKPGGFLVIVTKNLRVQGALRNLAGDTVALAQHAGLVYHQHVIALLAGIHEGELRARPSFWQLLHARNALARGERTQLVCHEDVLVFRRKPSTRSRTPKKPQNHSTTPR